MSDTNTLFTFMDVIQIFLLLLACFFCYQAGRFSGAVGIVNMMLDNNIIDEEHLDELTEKLKSQE
jgi:hypothetical protein